MDTLSKQQIDMYVATFSQQMDFTNKKQQYNFKTKMNNYAKKEEFNLTYELFKLCIKQQQQIEKQPEVIQAQVIRETPDKGEKTEKEILLEYQQQIEELPNKYKTATQMEEFHEVVDKMETYLCDLTPHEDNDDLLDEIYGDLDEKKEKIIYKIGVPIDDWTYWGHDKQKDLLIYSPQSYNNYIESIDNFIKKNEGVAYMRMTQFKDKVLKNKELNTLLKSFKVKD